MEDGKPTPKASDWRELAARASQESDPQKLSELVKQLCDRLDEIEQEKKKPSQSAVTGANGCGRKGN